MKNLPKYVTQLFPSVFLFLGLILVFYASRYLGNDEAAATKPEHQTISYCNTGKGCQSRVGEGSVSLDILPATMPTGQPLDVTAELFGLTAETVTMEFVGRDMPMGLMPFNLKKQSEHTSGSGRYTGTGSVSFCTADHKMVWMAKLKIETKEAIHTVLFELDTGEGPGSNLLLSDNLPVT